eukprot:gene6017-5322_t
MDGNASGQYDSFEPGKETSSSAAAQRLISASENVYSEKEGHKSVWLDAWSDPVAGVNAFNSCVHTCNLFGDGEWRLVVADEDRKLKVWRGTQKASDPSLLNTPITITSFWTKVMEGSMDIGEVVSMLAQLQEQGVILQTRSLHLMNLPDAEKKLNFMALGRSSIGWATTKKLTFMEHWQGAPLVATTVITCMDVINLAVDEGAAVVRNIYIGATPSLIAIQGELEVGYTITVAARDGKVYTIRNGEVSQTIIQLEAAAVGLIRLGKNFMVGCMNDVVHSYQNNGHKNYSIYLPASIHCIAKLEVSSSRMSRCLLVALSNGEIRIYSDRNLVGMHTVPSPVTGMWFGRYGREDSTLITITKSGALDIKILPRHAILQASSKNMGPPPEQDIPLQTPKKTRLYGQRNWEREMSADMHRIFQPTPSVTGPQEDQAVPKKTRLYVEQTNREREMPADMHRIFQRDLAKLRLTTARAYVKILTDGQGAVAFTSSANLSLNITAQGLGPRFKLILTVRNDGTSHVRDVPVALKYNEKMYRLDKTSIYIPLLVGVLCLDPESGSDTISVVMLSPHSSMPILQAQLRMPVSELEEE